ncbi:MAG TPA: sugar transferase [Candidatus Kapabacteria bacterium]|nr:sugar transferase [Candidatus Kapabacteria bacterium]
MTRRKEMITLLIGDFLAINAAWILFYWLRLHSGWFVVRPGLEIGLGSPIMISLNIYLFWLAAFLFFGLYRSWYVRPIFDEIVTILKTLGFGVLAFMVLILTRPSEMSDSFPKQNDPRLLGLIYFCCISILVVTVRLLVRYSQRRLLEAGIGMRSALIVGETAKATQLAQNLSKARRLGYQVIGYVNTNGTEDAVKASGLHRVGSYAEIEQVIEREKVKEVLIALDSGEHERLLDLVGRLSGQNIGLKIMPDLYDIISGQARTREIYGFPLIDINPELMRPWEEAAKRILDIVVSACVLVIGLPLWLIVALAVRLTSRGPVIYSQERVGKNGTIFQIFKFRSMSEDAEKGGPQWAQKNDPRVTPFGKFLRKTHLDEVPQFWNVLRGDMSLVGPRPEREFFVKQLSLDIPYYRRRLKVRPGITGLYQAMVDKYDENLDDVRNRLKHDLMYIESISFRLDIKILLRTAYMMLKGKGQA